VGFNLPSSNPIKTASRRVNLKRKKKKKKKTTTGGKIALQEELGLSGFSHLQILPLVLK